MARISQVTAIKGSQKWIQKLVNEKSDLLNSLIRTQINFPVTDTITWLSPLAEDGYAEYQDQAFLDLLDITLNNVPLSDFCEVGDVHLQISKNVTTIGAVFMKETILQ